MHTIRKIIQLILLAIFTVLGLACCPSPVSAQMRVSSEISWRYGPLIDSLVAFIGERPAEIKSNSGVLVDGQLQMTKDGWLITIANHTQRGRFAVLHEFGHFLNAVRGQVFYAYLDSLNLNEKFDRQQHQIWEQFADDFAGAWEAQENGWGESFRPGVNLLRRMLWTNANGTLMAGGPK